MKRSEIRRRSPQRARQMREVRVPMVEQANESTGCQVCPILARARIYLGCSGVVGGMHERRKSSSGGSRENPANLLAACNLSNDFIEDQPELVREHFGTELVVREGDPEWEALGERAWRLR